ncbi:MAG: site-specific integrase [Ruminococcus sp.]|uniref:site-specific integrase n=1 Tax=Ruminococcus sp. TaxID=41978 RepID=UPI0025E90443|nr:site-specific integrase [Ruminococcus sp.]MBR6996144.1 site-specific integrase [Ruminococcus sp.]
MATIKKRGDSYLIRVSCGYDINGNHMEQSMTWKPEKGMTPKQIKKEVERQATLFEEACNYGYKTSAIKFQELAEEWFEEYANLNLRHTTLYRMRNITHRVYPLLGHLRIDKITVRHIQGFINSLAKEGANINTGKPLSRKTIIHHLTFISDVFSYAIRSGLVSDNPCSKVIIPKGESKEKEIYSQEEMMKLLSLMQDQPLKYRVFFFLLAYSGFRRAEMLGLEWKDVDFDNCTISVRRTANYVSGVGTYTDTTKTRRSQRTLKIAVQIIEMLRDLQDEQADEALRLGDKWVDTDRIFTRWNGETMGSHTPYKWLRDLCDANELPFYGIHSFRHFAASSMISAGIDVTTVSGALGHCNSATTLNIYSHVFQTAQARVSEAMDCVFGFLQKG